MALREGRNLKQLLTEFGQMHVNFDYHEPSNTHIAYCLAIGRQGIKGFGHTADFAFEKFIQNLTDTLTDAPDDELTYWSERCETEADAAKRQAQIKEITSRPLSCQIGVAVPERIARWVSVQANKQRLSRNQFVTKLLTSACERLERRIQNEFTDAIREDIKKEAGNGEKEWSQRVEPELQARLILLARHLEISVAMLTRYFHVKEYQSSIKDYKPSIKERHAPLRKRRMRMMVTEVESNRGSRS